MKRRGSTAFKLLIIALILVLGYQTYKIILPREVKLDTIANEALKKITFDDMQVKKIQILTDEIREVGKIKTLEVVEYIPFKDTEETPLTFRGIVANAYFNVSYEYDLSQVEVQRENGNITILLNNGMDVTVNYDAQKSSMNSEASWFAKKYTAEEVNAIISALQSKVMDKAANNHELIDKAYISLEGTIRGICGKLGIENVIIEYGGE